MAFVLGLVSNIAANVIFWALLGSAFWGASRVVVRRFFRFFGLVRIDSMGVYLSNLWTPQASPSGRSVGYSISLHELRAAQSVEKLFGSAPLRLPDLVRGLVDALWLNRQVRCMTDVCPMKAEDADLDRNLIIVGSSMRNSVRAHYIKAGLPSAILTGEDVPADIWAAMSRARSITIARGGIGKLVSSRDSDSVTQPMAGMPGGHCSRDAGTRFMMRTVARLQGAGPQLSVGIKSSWPEFA